MLRWSHVGPSAARSPRSQTRPLPSFAMSGLERLLTVLSRFSVQRPGVPGRPHRRQIGGMRSTLEHTEARTRLGDVGRCCCLRSHRHVAGRRRLGDRTQLDLRTDAPSSGGYGAPRALRRSERWRGAGRQLVGGRDAAGDTLQGRGQRLQGRFREDKPLFPLPSCPEVDDPAYRVVKIPAYAWKASAARRIENFVDFSHSREFTKESWGTDPVPRSPITRSSAGLTRSTSSLASRSRRACSRGTRAPVPSSASRAAIRCTCHSQ